MGIFDIFKKEKKTNEIDWVSMIPKEMADLLLNEIKTNPQACKFDVIPQGIGEFGLDKSNPIPIYGIPSNEIYLNKLRTMKGERIRFRRFGSSEHVNIIKLIDEYEIFNNAGDTIAKLYLSPYHWKTSDKAPKGFKIAN